MRRSHRHTLKPGKYSVTISAQRADVPGSKPHTLRFTIVT